MNRKIKRRHRPGRKPTIFMAIIGIITATALLTVGVLYMVGVTSLEADSVRYYEVKFYTLNDNLYYSNTYRRGEKLDSIPNPTQEYDDTYRYTFIGWDLTGDFIADILPNKVYYPINAKAVYITSKIGGSL